MSFSKKLLLNALTIDHHGLEQPNQAIAIRGEEIAWCGSMDVLPPEYKQEAQVTDCSGDLVTPGLIDCHTHLVYAGNRSAEFKQRLQGVSYAEIAQKGGGINSTVKHTRHASEEELFQQSLPRMLAMQAEGVTTVEIKSGYGLDLKNEIKMLQVARKLGDLTGMRVQTTFLGAHAVPPEFANQNQAYIDYLCEEMMPTIAESNLADAVDVFCESIGFSYKQTEQVLKCATSLNLPIKCHAEQLSSMGASSLAASLGALSCDHLEYLDKAGAEAMAQAGTVAVLLPGAYYFLRETHRPPIALLRQQKIGIAIATDCNPGSSPTTSLRLMMNMACQLFSMTVSEVLSAVTYQAARALGLAHQVGSISAGLSADLVHWFVKDSADLCYSFGSPVPHQTMKAGQWQRSVE